MGATSNSKQALWLGIGQLFSYAISIVSPMVLSRYFDKVDYGTYKQVMYVYNTLLVVFTLGLPRAYAYFIPRVSVEESKDVIRKITNIFIVLGVTFSSILYLFSTPIALLLKNPDLNIALKWFAPTPLFLLPVMGLEGILASYQKTQYYAIYTVITRVFTLICIVIPVIFFHGTYIDAIIGFDVASFLTFLLFLYIKNLPVRRVKLLHTSISYRDIFSFSIPLFTATIWIMITVSANQFFISRYYGTEEFADFSNGFMEFPLAQMVVASVASVLLPLFSGMIDRQQAEIKKVWIGALEKSIKIIYPMMIYCILFSTLVMTCFYGDQYEKSGIYFAIRNFEFFFAVIPFYPILIALGKTKTYSNIHMIVTLLIVPIEYLIVKIGESAVFLEIVFIIFAILKLIMQFYVVSKEMKLSLSELLPLSAMGKSTMISLLSCIPSIFIMSILSNMSKYFLLFLTIIVFGLFYYTLCWIFKLTYRDIMLSLCSKTKMLELVKLIP